MIYSMAKLNSSFRELKKVKNISQKAKKGLSPLVEIYLSVIMSPTYILISRYIKDSLMESRRQKY